MAAAKRLEQRAPPALNFVTCHPFTSVFGIIDPRTGKMAVLTFLDPGTFKPIKRLTVTVNGTPRDSLNELEYINGYIYANVWLTDYILKIDPATGKVVGRLRQRRTLFTRSSQRENPWSLS